MSFGESPLEWGEGMKCNPGRLFRYNPRVALKFRSEFGRAHLRHSGRFVEARQAAIVEPPPSAR